MWRALGLLLGLSCLSCNKLKLLQQAQATEQAAPAPSASVAPESHAEKKETAAAAEARPRSDKYALPFAWETSELEPLAKARSFLREVLLDNQRNAARGTPAFKPFAEKQAPRATVLTCADSRVQSDAWDASAENDDFTVRNIGNQVPNALGSLAYGVEELKTPVLLIIGHTGCGAVKAAMNKLEGLDGPIKKELEGLHLPELKSAAPNQMWASAVIANVNEQVATAVEHFGTRIQEGDLIVLGAVYDFRNDLRGGAGKLHLVNVNANTEPERLKAFSAALMLGQTAGPMPSESSPKTALKGLLNPASASPPQAHPSHGHPGHE
jgi:carbonic anhydrase